MNPNWFGRRGTTLIEVLLGLVLLGTVLSATLIARGRFMRSWADADRKLRLTHATDHLLAHWLAPDATPPAVPDSGTLPYDADGQWTTSIINDPSAEALQALKVRLDVVDIRDASVQVRVEFLIHHSPPTTQPQQAVFTPEAANAGDIASLSLYAGRGIEGEGSSGFSCAGNPMVTARPPLSPALSPSTGRASNSSGNMRAGSS